MAQIRKRGATSAPLTKPERPPIVQQCHYTIFRHPLKDTAVGTFHKGPEPADILAVYHGVVSMQDWTTIETVYNDIVAAKYWFIITNPGRYSVIGNVFGMSFTFLVMQDGTIHKGWLRWPQFLRWEREHGINPL